MIWSPSLVTEVKVNLRPWWVTFLFQTLLRSSKQAIRGEKMIAVNQSPLSFLSISLNFDEGAAPEFENRSLILALRRSAFRDFVGFMSCDAASGRDE